MVDKEKTTDFTFELIQLLLKQYSIIEELREKGILDRIGIPYNTPDSKSIIEKIEEFNRGN